MNTKGWYLPYFKGVYHTRMTETFTNENAHMVHIVHTMFNIYIVVESAMDFGIYIYIYIPSTKK